ncbi:MAG: hypothetical protein PHV34_00040 [Verrucomicrobiae bacterium]|nr:hypothetical protein [Verrucomicrobiae bacterium]
MSPDSAQPAPAAAPSSPAAPAPAPAPAPAAVPAASTPPSADISLSRLIYPFWLLILALNLLVLFLLHSTWVANAKSRQEKNEITQQIAQARVNAENARVVQSVLERLAGELLFLADSDQDIRRLVDKYQIKKGSSESR